MENKTIRKVINENLEKVVNNFKQNIKKSYVEIFSELLFLIKVNEIIKYDEEIDIYDVDWTYYDKNDVDDILIRIIGDVKNIEYLFTLPKPKRSRISYKPATNKNKISLFKIFTESCRKVIILDNIYKKKYEKKIREKTEYVLKCSKTWPLSDLRELYLYLIEDNFKYILQFADIAFKKEAYHTSLTFYEKYVEVYPRSLREQKRRLRCCINLEDYQKVIEISKAINIIDPGNYYIYIFHIGWACYKLRKYKEALNSFEKVLDLLYNTEHSYKTLVAASNSCIRLGLQKKALCYTLKLCHKYPNEEKFETCLGIGEACINLNMTYSALKYFRKSVSLLRSKYNNGTLYLKIGLLKKKLENLPESLKYFEEALIKFIINDDYKNSSITYLEIAEIYFKKGLYDKATYFGDLVSYQYLETQTQIESLNMIKRELQKCVY